MPNSKIMYDPPIQKFQMTDKPSNTEEYSKLKKKKSPKRNKIIR